jgi:hypothetical protein
VEAYEAATGVDEAEGIVVRKSKESTVLRSCCGADDGKSKDGMLL